MSDERLRESVEIEQRADFFAATGNLREAVSLMREVNSLRAMVFGKLEPNELRERTLAALAAKPLNHRSE